VKPVVVKLGGAVAADAAELVLELAARQPVVVVHGAGAQISAELERRGLEVRFLRGRRVTSAAAIPVVRESLAEVNAAVCDALGERAVPLFGDEIGLKATLLPELGYVGEAVPSAPPAVTIALAAGLIPVVAPLAAGPLNVNADEAAAALAVGLDAERLLFISDVPGLLLGGAVTASIDAADAQRLLDADELAGGIVPKLQAAVGAARSGVRAEIGATAVVA
jgi:acetylglutamate kinase